MVLDSQYPPFRPCVGHYAVVIVTQGVLQRFIKTIRGIMSLSLLVILKECDWHFRKRTVSCWDKNASTKARARTHTHTHTGTDSHKLMFTSACCLQVPNWMTSWPLIWKEGMFWQYQPCWVGVRAVLPGNMLSFSARALTTVTSPLRSFCTLAEPTARVSIWCCCVPFPPTPFPVFFWVVFFVWMFWESAWSRIVSI